MTIASAIVPATGFYMIGTLVVKGLKKIFFFWFAFFFILKKHGFLKYVETRLSIFLNYKTKQNKNLFAHTFVGSTKEKPFAKFYRKKPCLS